MNISSNSIVITTIHCSLYRFLGFLLFIASFFNIYICSRYFINQYSNKRKYFTINRTTPITIGMLFSSTLIILTIVPVVIIQCCTCQSYLSYKILCKIHGFVCFSTGLFNMYIVALLSFSRYLSVLHKTSWLNQLLEQHSGLNVLCCALLAICWTLPPVFGIGNKYIREGVGFYCSLDWKDPSIYSRIYLTSVVLFNYFIPLILLVYSNLRVCFTLHHLLKSSGNSKYIPLSKTSDTTDRRSSEIDLTKCLIDVQLKETTNRLQRLKIDRHYAFITFIIAAQYLITWTPYTLVEILNVIGQNTFIQRNPFLPTLCGLLAKFSLILNPLVLIYSNKMTET
ncbi:unnamed protein product [Rotaria sordida]|uniref:G-protein coupled receptors family 1 profile domain-containing protein n=2 Tax=Rotaria sordida TaxID=392033 RepID=A0A815P0P1_9BILA|nr:unnamed protein product [Rotaria sordida]CAF3849511.1 unnamed protein product [Rotaria sordida]